MKASIGFSLNVHGRHLFRSCLVGHTFCNGVILATSLYDSTRRIFQPR